MKNNKTLSVSELFRRKGFFFFLGLIAFIQSLLLLYFLWQPQQSLEVFEPIPSIFIDSLKEVTANKIVKPIQNTNSLRPYRPKAKTSKTPITLLAINKADPLALEKIYGIGPVLSKRIVKYKNAIGGFVHMDQLYEVYGLDSLVVAEMKTVYGVVLRPAIVAISLNAATAYELSRLPFVSRAMGERIVEYRAKHGLFNNYNELLNILILPQEKIDLIKLYLTL